MLLRLAAKKEHWGAVVARTFDDDLRFANPVDGVGKESRVDEGFDDVAGDAVLRRQRDYTSWPAFGWLVITEPSSLIQVSQRTSQTTTTLRGTLATT